jgi:hypothetical protein
MKHPADDLDDRSRLWDQLQYFWMDTDPAVLLPHVARVCAESKYTLDELEAIFWNEVRPAVAFNLRIPTAPEWAGFDLEWLTARVLATHRYGRPLPWRWLYREDRAWWDRLAEAIRRLR